jgi:hypothetical protein
VGLQENNPDVTSKEEQDPRHEAKDKKAGDCADEDRLYMKVFSFISSQKLYNVLIGLLKSKI